MSKQIYSWKRFWCPWSGSINLADGGYLYDPDVEWGKVYNPDLVALEAIANIPCLVLLGEPGIGKSQELKNIKLFTEKKIANTSQILELNLRACANLKDDLFKDETFTDWLGDTYHLYLFLDSFDEGLLSVPTLATGLIDELKKQKYQNHINRLHLRLACRTFVFPEILDKGLKDLWQEDCVEIYELAPLRRVDVREAAKVERFSPDDFLKEIGHKDVVPLAIKPITLEFLLNTYRRHHGQFFQIRNFMNSILRDVSFCVRKLIQVVGVQTEKEVSMLSNA
jgi:predicted NACHT family NTPase